MSSAVHRQIHARHKTGRIAGQIRNRLGQLLSPSRPAHRMRRLRVLQKFGVRRLVHAATLVKIGDGHARVDRIAAHPFGGQLKGDAACELIDGRLGDVVGEHTGKRAYAVDARDVDDVAGAGDQMRHGQHGQMVDGTDVGVHHAIVLLQVGRFDGARLEDAGVVDQHVQFA